MTYAMMAKTTKLMPLMRHKPSQNPRVLVDEVVAVVDALMRISLTRGQRNERLPIFDEIRGELRSVARADVLRAVDGSCRDEQDVTGLDRPRRLALDLIFERAFEDIDDLFAAMRVPGGDISRVEVNAHRTDLASGNAEIVELQVGSFASRLLRLRPVRRETAADDQRR